MIWLYNLVSCPNYRQLIKKSQFNFYTDCVMRYNETVDSLRSSCCLLNFCIIEKVLSIEHTYF